MEDRFYLDMETYKAGDLEQLLVPWAWERVADARSGQGWLVFVERKDKELEPRAEEDGLLTDEEIGTVLLEVADWYYDAEVNVTVSYTAVAKAQDAKTAAAKDAEC